MSPAFEAAMQTTVPTVRIAARAEGSRHPSATKTTETPNNVTSVIADVGFDETPIKPTILEETTTKQIPKIATPSAAINRAMKGMLPARRFGTATRVTITAIGTTTTTQPGTSRSVRSSDAAVVDDARSPLTTARNDVTIVGSARATATRPAAA